MNSSADERSIATFAAIKTILEILIGKGVVPPNDVAAILRQQSADCQNEGRAQAAGILANLAAFAGDPERALGRRLLNEPPHGTA